MAKTYRCCVFFGKLNTAGIPANAIIIQCIITLLFIATGTFEQVITYIGFTLNLFTFLAVLGIFIIRRKQQQNLLHTTAKSWGYPFTTILFLLFGLWLMIYGIKYKPTESLLGLITLAVGTLVYVVNLRYNRNKK